jgi:hypothetical protein
MSAGFSSVISPDCVLTQWKTGGSDSSNNHACPANRQLRFSVGALLEMAFQSSQGNLDGKIRRLRHNEYQSSSSGSAVGTVNVASKINPWGQTPKETQNLTGTQGWGSSMSDGMSPLLAKPFTNQSDWRLKPEPAGGMNPVLCARRTLNHTPYSAFEESGEIVSPVVKRMSVP